MAPLPKQGLYSQCWQRFDGKNDVGDDNDVEACGGPKNRLLLFRRRFGGGDESGSAMVMEWLTARRRHQSTGVAGNGETFQKNT